VGLTNKDLIGEARGSAFRHVKKGKNITKRKGKRGGQIGPSIIWEGERKTDPKGEGTLSQGGFPSKGKYKGETRVNFGLEREGKGKGGQGVSALLGKGKDLKIGDFYGGGGGWRGGGIKVGRVEIY